MGWRGTLRSLEATARRMERERQRQLRLEEKQNRLREKLLEQEHNRLEAEDFEERLEQLVSVHKECGDKIAWVDILNTPPPDAPPRLSPHESKATADLNNYKPGLFDKLFHRIEEKQQILQSAIATAQNMDERCYQEQYEKYLQRHQSWAESHQLAEAILAGDTQAYQDAIEDLQPFAEMIELGCKFNFVFHSPHLVEVALTVDGDHIIPTEIISVTASGKLSTKKMPAARFNELYQDYVCGCVLRIGREFFAVLPVETVLVNAYAIMLNPQTGHQEVTPVVGTIMPRTTLERLNFDSVDPSDSMRNFIHRMGFKRSEGFSAIEALTVAEAPNVSSK